MRLTRFIPVLATVALVLGCFVASAQQPGDDEVRGAFLSSRPKTTNTNVRPRPRPRPRPTNTGASASVTVTSNSNRATDGRVKAAVGPIGLGYTLFMRDQVGRAVRVDPSREFRNGDQVRVSM